MPDSGLGQAPEKPDFEKEKIMHQIRGHVIRKIPSVNSVIYDQSPDELISRAKSLRSKGKYKEAWNLFMDALKIDPNNQYIPGEINNVFSGLNPKNGLWGKLWPVSSEIDYL